MNAKYLILNILLLTLFIPAFTLGLIGVDTVFEIKSKSISGFFGMMIYAGYLTTLAVTAAVSIKHHYKP